MPEEKPGFVVTTSDASETVLINNDPPAAAPQPKVEKPIAQKGVTNADTP